MRGSRQLKMMKRSEGPQVISQTHEQSENLIKNYLPTMDKFEGYFQFRCPADRQGASLQKLDPTEAYNESKARISP